MKKLSLPTDFSSFETVLFLGSGFSKGATAINGKSLPLGGELDDRLARMLELPEGRYQGKTLAQIASKRDSNALKEFLESNLLVREFEDYHETILGADWYRVYTTNFDNLVETIRNEKAAKAEILTFRDNLPNKIEKNAVVHLHGYIGRVTRSNVQNELIYALNAYASPHSDQPEWFADFNRAVKFAKNVVFVGYSIEYDEHIRDILAKIPDLRSKTTFVLGGEPDRVIEEILDEYGAVTWVGSEGFASSLRELPDKPLSLVDKIE